MKTILICCAAAVLAGCANQTAQVQQQQNTNAANAPLRSEKLQTTTAHTTENQPPSAQTAGTPPAGGSKWSQSGNPIDTAEFDKAVAEAEKAAKAKPADETAKKNLAEAHFKRGFALTEARQYASALGDFRKALKNDPNHEESKKWMDQIVGIYGMLKKEYPKEGEEPPPLPFKKG